MDEQQTQMSNEQWPITDDAIREVFQALLRDGSWGRYNGPHCERLIADLRDYHAVHHVHLCSSGTSAVELTLRGLGVGAGDEVILAAYDFKSNFANILTVGAIPVLVDTLPGCPIPDPQAIAEALTERTRAVICSHLHGSFADIDGIRTISAERGIAVIEDACQATGAMIGHRRAGAVGDVGVLSFGGSKLLTAGRGGAILTNDAAVAQRIRLYVNRGNDAYPLSEMQAAVLVPQLQQLNDRNQLRLQNVSLLLALIANRCALSCTASIPEKVDGEGTRPQAVSLPAFYKLGFLAPQESDRAGIERLAEHARNRGVALDPAFPALHRIHARSRFRAVGDLPRATELHHRLLVLHHPILLGTNDAIRRTAVALTDLP